MTREALRRHVSTRSFDKTAIGRIEVVIAVGVLCIAVWFIVSALSRARTAEAREACLGNLGVIGAALERYLNDNDNCWPYVSKLASVKLHDPAWPTLPTVLAPYTGDKAELFRCPADSRALASDNTLREKFSTKTTWYETEGTSYEYWMGEAYAGKKVGEESLSTAAGFGLGRADQPLLTDFEPFHEGDGGGSFNTLNADLKPRTTRARKKD